MNKKIILLLALLLMLSTAMLVSAQNVGVKPGDWITYSVSFTGTPDPTHEVTSANMTVLAVQGKTIQVNILSTYSNGTQVSTNSTLDLATGYLIDNFIIPSGLTTGNEFNSNMGNMGKMMITNTTQGTCVGATRTVVSATYGNNTYFWDQATGVSVEGITVEPNYTMHSLATNTNMWTPQTTSGSYPDMMLIYVVIIVIVVIIIIVAAALAMSRRRR